MNETPITVVMGLFCLNACGVTLPRFFLGGISVQFVPWAIKCQKNGGLPQQPPVFL